MSRRPLTARLFLIAIGTPANGRSSPGPPRPRPRSARSASISTNAFSCGLSSSMRAKRDLDQLARGDLARAHHARELARRAEHQIAVGHGSSSDDERGRSPARGSLPATIWPAHKAADPRQAAHSPESECHERGSVTTRGPVGPRRRRRLRHRDRRARQSGRRAALPRRRHRETWSAPSPTSRSGACSSTDTSNPACRRPNRTR